MKNQNFKKEITQQIIKLMQNNGSGWIKGWAGDTNINLQMPINTTTGNYYQGINVLKLWFAEKSTNEWATYKQWQDKDKQVKKGEKGTSILSSSKL